VIFSRTAGGWGATITAAGGATGTRTLDADGASCAALGNALVAASALLVEDAAAGAQPTGAAAPALSASVPTSAPAPAPAPASAPMRPPGSVALGERAAGTRAVEASAPRVDLELGAGVAAGVLAPASLFGTAGAAYHLAPHVAIGVEAWGVPTQTVAYAPGTIGLWMAAGSPFVCATTDASAAGMRLSACAQPVFGVVRAWGSGYPVDRSGTEPWVALAAGLRASGSIAGPLQWSARVEPLLLLDGQSFAVDNLGVGYSPQRFALVATMGVRASIW